MTVVMVPGNAYCCDVCAAVVMDKDRAAHERFHKRGEEAWRRTSQQIAFRGVS